jgi:hypothetical protein
MTFRSGGRPPEWGTTEHVPVSELARRQGVNLVVSVDELARPELFESDEELAAFLADLTAARHGLARASSSSIPTSP